ILIKKSIEIKEKVSLFWKFISKSIALFVGILIPIIASIIYFVAIGSGKDYLDYGLLYNIRYSGSWHPEFPNQLIAFFFSLPGKVLIMAGLIYVLSFAKKKISPIFKFISGWFILSLFASLLSNRPYPHYLLQVVPAFSLLVGVFLNKITLWKKQYRELLLGTLLFALPIYIMLLLNVRPYETGHYYSQFYKFVSGEITNEEYDSGFNPMVNDNYQVAKIIRGMNLDRIFIWGTNPMLYAVSETTPTSRFTVSFHIKDFKDHERTLAQIKKEKPRMIVVMKDENEKFYELQQYLDSFYYANDTQYQTMTVYLRQTDN
ncbi:MAG: hypothetical protein CO040_01610, partial [Candidatus Pacebacteria bacterium CG_4_9_14_0_2_um_filter_36_8]